MKCTCGKKYDLLNTRLIVDSIEKEYYCLPCSQKMLMTRDRKNNIIMTTFTTKGKKVEKWNTSVASTA